LCPNTVAISKKPTNNLLMEKRSLDLKSYLQEELVLRCNRNPSYSLRSFAKALDLSPSFLSKILNGQRRITDQVFQKVATHLDLEPKQIEQLSENKNSLLCESNFKNLQIEYFKMISDWYHYALLELTHCEGFRNSPDWIASKLGITVNQAKAAIERLLHLELLEMKNGKLCATTGGNTTTKNDFTDFAFKKMQDDLLKKAIHSLWNDNLNERDHTSICMAIDPSDLPEVKKRLTKMRREICQYLERPQKKKRTQVYNLSLSFFSLSQEST
jgi:transcriptional regulator with XRE-family HTH domain